ncbi:ECF-type sigma factor [Bowmanella pacifica]|uniref:Extracytoplasmic sigma factor ECF n=1 Tax=Bowmanella pacifica TaxID=502051 RepID=A0A917YXJ0_9ALTE|nr:ECF-type sigma factor [Bowmanella pacifica]GGO68725.1 extracytoplasmic sigma factor ECF [Bowmanella pacifica]
MNSTNLNYQVDQQGLTLLIDSFYQQLKKVASTQRWMIGLKSGTLCTTVLVHESFLRLKEIHSWTDSQHFLRTASKAMRYALIDYIRAQNSEKRSAPKLDEWLSILDGVNEPDTWLLDIGDALAQLELQHPRAASVVECLFFAGLTEKETGELLSINERTVRRDWQKARCWLATELCPQE